MDAAPRRHPLRIAGAILAAVIVVLVAFKLAGDIRELRSHPLPGARRWDLIAVSGALFLAAHAMLVQTWRSVLSCWDARISFWTAARIWSVSSLARYLPGKLWQIGAMGLMAKSVGISPAAASASAVLGTLVNIIAGIVVALASGQALLDRTTPGGGTAALTVVAVALVALCLAPFVVPHLVRAAGRLTGRAVEATLPPRAVVYALVGNVLAWLVYGLAFRLFMHGVLGASTGGYSAHLAAYTISYIVGYLFLPAPAGVGVREVTMVSVLQLAGLATAPQAALVAIASRVWLTILEVTPGVLFWARHRARRHSPTIDPSDVPT